MQITYLFLNKYIFFIIYIKIIQKHGKKINSTSLNNGKQNKKTDSTLRESSAGRLVCTNSLGLLTEFIKPIS
jgi:hypothetical protein